MYSTYQELTSALEKMFSCITIGQCGSHGAPGKEMPSECKFRDILSESEYVLTYEDKDGDWMLVGRCPVGPISRLIYTKCRSGADAQQPQQPLLLPVLLHPAATPSSPIPVLLQLSEAAQSNSSCAVQLQVQQQFLRTDLGSCASSSSPCAVQRISQLRSPAPKQPCAVCATIPHSGHQACVVQPSAQSSALRSHTSLFRVALMADPTRKLPLSVQFLLLRLYLGGKRKTRWILGKEPKPIESDPTFDEWVADTMYAHARNESRIFELYRDISHASQPALGLLVADYFGYLQTRWEELAQYEPFSDFSSDGAVESKRLDRRHTYQFLMGLKPEFKALRTQILNTSPLPSLYEAFAIVDGDERRRRLLPSISLPETSSTVPDQTAFVAPFGTRPYCHTVTSLVTLLIAALFYILMVAVVVVQLLESALLQNRTMHIEIPNLNQLQPKLLNYSRTWFGSLIIILWSMANIAAESPTALHSSSSFPGIASDLVMEEGSAHPRSLPILDSPPPSLSGSPAPVPLPASSPDSGISSPVISDLPSPRYPTRVDSVSTPRSIHEALFRILYGFLP
ncbi:indole-3-acetic acid inducible 9 [Actinidia rufa]|uniref:Auxin-responsive protein n=1 Tax=Actinidia rufa TaxID=165716 RepID=A0A7J0EV16_9ERIC|nr:indole-3-acetic acid inducible 9 [Actinidia rufa]